MDRLALPPRVRVVQDVVVDEGRGVDHLDRRRQLQHPFVIIAIVIIAIVILALVIMAIVIIAIVLIAIVIIAIVLIAIVIIAIAILAIAIVALALARAPRVRRRTRGLRLILVIINSYC